MTQAPPVPSAVPSGADLERQLARLDAVVDDLGSAPADRDAVLWAAHEFARCARLLIESRQEPATSGDLDPAVAHARSAMLSLTIARRHDGGTATP